MATALDLTGLYNSRDSTGSGEGLRRRRFQATPRQPGLNSHLNASEVALTAITADGRLLTHALPAKAEPPASPPASLGEASLSLTFSLCPPLSLCSSVSFFSFFLPASFPFARCLCANVRLVFYCHGIKKAPRKLKTRPDFPLPLVVVQSRVSPS